MHLQKKHVLPTLVQIVGAVALWTLPSVTQADVIIEHLGYSFPQQNGWTQSARSGPDTTEAAVPDDLGYIDSLGLYSDSTGEQSFYRLLAVNEVNRALTEGWALTAIVRIHQCESGGAVVQFGTGSKVYRIDVCSLWTGLALGTGYHVYRLVDANADGSADLFVDGVQVTSNFLGGPWSAGPVVEFGDVVHSYVANAIAYYAQVKFEVDPIELSGGCNDTVVDCNGNGVLDPCEPYIPSLMDCNGNSILDDCEIGGDASLDCNRDGVLDECAMEPDCNANGIPDECDLAEHTSTDCNHNLVLDECDLLCSQGGPDDYVVVAPNTPGGHNNPNTSPVFVFSLQATGPLVSRPNLPGGEVLDPAGVAFDSYGELFVGNRDGNSGPGSISRFKFDGCGNWRFNGQILGNGLEAVHQVAFSPITGELFAVNYWTGTVSRFLFDSQRNAIPNGIIEANAQTGGGGLTVSPNGEVFVSAPDGIHRFLIGENGQATPNGTMPGGACMHFSQQGELLL